LIDLLINQALYSRAF